MVFRRQLGVAVARIERVVERMQTQLEFAETLCELHPQQAEAVAYTDGPLLVLAGPGTGKVRRKTA